MDLLPRADVTGGDKDHRPPAFKAVGITLAVCSGLFIGSSFVLKKHGLLKANAKYNEKAGEGYGYLKNVWWWTGMTLMIVGEICNFVAYSFVDAVLVTPFGALSIVVTAILSAVFLKERLSLIGKIGCANCVVGAVVIALNAPEQSVVATIQEMKDFVLHAGFLSYAGVVLVGSIFAAVWAGPRYGKRNMFVYISICSAVGGLSVVATQGLGAAIVTQISGKGPNQFDQWFLYVLFAFVVCTLVTEIIFLNKALNIFQAAAVTVFYYLLFTTATMVTSAVLFRGFAGTPTSIITIVLGFLFICSGVTLVQLAKSAKDVPDTVVFTGDLDQVRTMAEQEERESEPRADSVRGSAALVRALSRKRTLKQLDEARSIREEHMQPIGEDDQVYFDGIRRRRTVLSQGTATTSVAGSVRRTRTVHPPLGMTHFPEDDDGVSHLGSDDGSLHPGFFSRLRHSVVGDKAQHGDSIPPVPSNVPLTEIKTSGAPASLDTRQVLPRHDEDTYGGDGTSAWRRQHTSSPRPPRPPAHHVWAAKRQFSFQSVFSRKQVDGSADDEDREPLSGGANSSGRGFAYPSDDEEEDVDVKDWAGEERQEEKRERGRPLARTRGTEEERLGLVAATARRRDGSDGSPAPAPPVARASPVSAPTHAPAPAPAPAPPSAVAVQWDNRRGDRSRSRSRSGSVVRTRAGSSAGVAPGGSGLPPPPPYAHAGHVHYDDEEGEEMDRLGRLPGSSARHGWL